MKNFQRSLSQYAPIMLAGVILVLAQTASFAQTSTATTSMLLAPATPVASAHAHSTAASAAPATTQSQPMAHKDRKHMHVKNWMTQPNGLSGVAPLDPNSVPKFVNQLSRPATFVATATKFDRTID